MASERGAGARSPAAQLIGTPRKRTISAREVDHGQEHARWNAAGRRGATTRVWRSGARPRWQDVTTAQDGGGTAVVSRRRPKLMRAKRLGYPRTAPLAVHG